MIKFMKSLFALLFGLLTGGFKTAKKTGIVIVGMQNSAKYGSCPGAGLDAGRMLGILSKYGKPVVLQDRQATKGIVSTELLNAVKNNDLTIFFFSGHGGSDPIGDVTGETDGKNEYICLYNGYMLDNEIWNIVSQSKGRVFMIFDCCHSETMFRSPGVNFRQIAIRQEIDEKLRNEYGLEPRGKKNVNLLVWSGCPDNGLSYGSDKGGFLTNAICKALKDYPKFATYNQIWNSVGKSGMVKKQSPKKTMLGGGFGGPVFR